MHHARVQEEERADAQTLGCGDSPCQGDDSAPVTRTYMLLPADGTQMGHGQMGHSLLFTWSTVTKRRGCAALGPDLDLSVRQSLSVCLLSVCPYRLCGLWGLPCLFVSLYHLVPRPICWCVSTSRVYILLLVHPCTTTVYNSICNYIYVLLLVYLSTTTVFNSIYNYVYVLVLVYLYTSTVRNPIHNYTYIHTTTQYTGAALGPICGSGSNLSAPLYRDLPVGAPLHRVSAHC
jgi:hypothetical protein